MWVASSLSHHQGSPWWPQAAKDDRKSLCDNGNSSLSTLHVSNQPHRLVFCWLKWSTTQVLFSVGTLLQTGRFKKKSWQWILRHRRCWAVQVFCILCHCTLVSLSLPPVPIILHESSLLPTFPTSADPSGYLPCLVLALHTQDMFLCFFWWPVPCLLPVRSCCAEPIQELLISLSRHPWLPACQETLFCSGGCP